MSPNLPNICGFYSSTVKIGIASAAFRNNKPRGIYGEMKIQKKIVYIYAT